MTLKRNLNRARGKALGFSAAKCPECGRRSAVRVIYGLPGEGLAEAAARGDVDLGGCVIQPLAPNRRCRSCGHAFRAGLLGNLAR